MRISPSLEGIPASVEGGQRRYTSRLMARSGTGGRHDVAQVLLWCLLHIPAAIQAATPTGQDVLFGELQMVSVSGAAELGNPTRHEHHAYIRLASGELRRLLFPTDIPPEERLPPTGSRIMVQPMARARCKQQRVPGHPVCVASMMASEGYQSLTALQADQPSREDLPASDRFPLGQPRGRITVKAIIFILNICGWGTATNATALAKVLYNDSPGAGPYSLQGMFSACSYGAANFSRQAGSSIEARVISLPCSGTTHFGTQYDSNQCPYPEWSDAALNYAETSLGLDLSQYPFRVFVLPAKSPCWFGGMGWTSCYGTGDCRTWVNGQLWNKPAAYFHELGHNLFLNHAGTRGDRGYGDLSGAMGYCCDLRCYNAPHLYQLGWAGPLATLHKGNFPPGKWRRFELPSASNSARHFLKIRPDWSDLGSGYNFFVSYRKRQGYDVGLDGSKGFADRVMVHTVSRSQQTAYSSFEQSLQVGERWQEMRLDTQVVYVVMGSTPNSITLGVCRTNQPLETYCADGLDNDCDGWVDSADPDCQRTSVA